MKCPPNDNVQIARDENLVELECEDEIVLIFEKRNVPVFFDELTKVIPSFESSSVRQLRQGSVAEEYRAGMTGELPEGHKHADDEDYLEDEWRRVKSKESIIIIIKDSNINVDTNTSLPHNHKVASQPCRVSSGMHFADLVLREVAAEGLEGVTLERLWGYLSSQDSGFPFKLDTNSKQFIWEALLAMKCLSFYVNPTKDDLPGTFDRRTWLVDDDRGLFYETPANFRPRKFFPAETLAEIGSCPFYTKRVDVSEEVRKTPDFRKLSNVEEKWGDLLVVVASQHERTKCLFGNRCHPSDVSIGTYVVLEAIARNRFNGLPTTVADGLGCCGLNGSSIWYARQKLEALGLITSQPYISKFQSQPMATGLLLHHWRYYRHFPFPNATLIKKVLQLLQGSPKKAHTSPYLRNEVGLTYKSFRRLLHFASRQGFVTTSDSTMKEACAFFKNKDPESITTEDLQMFAQENAIPRCGPQAPLVIVHLKNSANIEAWFSSFGAVKGISPGARSEGDSEEEEEAVEEVVDTGSGDTAALVAPTRLDDSSEGNSSSHTLTPSVVAELQSDSKSSSVLPTLRACEKTLAMAPSVNGEESLMVQFARLMLPQEITMASLLKLTRLNYFFSRRLLRAFDNLCAVRTTKRSLRATFILCRQMMTDVERLEYMQNEKTSSKTQREKRRTFILNYLSEKRIVPSVSALRQVIWDHEAAEGLTVKMDHKSLHRIIEELLKSKLLVIHVVKSIQGELRFLCHPDIRKDDPLVVSAVEAHNLELLKKRPRLSDVRTGDQILLNQDFKKLTEKAMQPVTVLANLCPRLRRRLLLHEYLFYVLYVLPCDMEPLIPSSNSTPAVYHKEYSWRRYVGPLSPPDGMERGWFSLNDLLRAMPFGLYLHLICGASLPKIMCRWLGLKKYLGKISAQELQELDGQLMLERVQDVPLAELFLFPLESVQPPGGRFGRVSSWLFSITRVRSMLNLLEEMTIHNLVSLFDQKTPTDPANTVKVLAYLHRNAGLLDTRYANPAHRVLTDLEKCPFLRFHFNTMSDVANYWQTCEVICRNTPLGHRLIKTDLDKQNPLPVDRTLIPWSDDQRDKVVDDGSLPVVQWPSDALPGDYQPFNIDNQLVYPCGACGLNPLDFSYLSRNWDRKQQRAHLNTKETSSESESDTVDGAVESVWRFPSTDRVPLNPEEPFWQWDHRLFEDTDFQAAYDIIPNLGPTTSDHHPSESRRAYGFFSVTSKYLTRSTSDSMEKGKESVGSREGSPVQPSSVSAQKPDASDDDHTGGKPSELAVSNKRAMQKPRKPLRTAQRRRPLIKEDRRSSRFRNPRCCWSPIEDQLLVVCRVASLVIGGSSSREFLSVPYSTVRDVLQRYIPHVKPPKTVHAYARRMKFILVLRRSECTAVNILLARVSARPDLQRKFNYGRNRWYALCRDAPNTAERVFHSAVDCIISEFVPRLNQLRPEAKITPTSPSTADILDEAVSENVEVPRGNEPPAEADSSGLCDHKYRISGSRSEVEQKYSLFKLNNKTQSQGLADVGKNRVAVVVYSLYNYAMSSFRFLPDPTHPFRSFIFSRVLHQYPRIQLGQTLSLLMAGKLATASKMPTIQKNERILHSKRVKLSQRFLHWVWYELVAQTKHVCQARLLWKATDPQLLESRTECSSEEPLLVHSFKEHTSGGEVAVFLELMLQDQFLQFDMDFQVGSITFIRDATINEEQSKASSKRNDIRGWTCQIRCARTSRPPSRLAKDGIIGGWAIPLEAQAFTSISAAVVQHVMTFLGRNVFDRSKNFSKTITQLSPRNRNMSDTCQHEMLFGHYSAVRSYESRYTDNDISSDVTPTKSGDTPGHRKSSSVIRRELLPQLQEIPACFHDRQFWLNAAYSNRFRWFENRLSFCQSQLILRNRPCTEDTGRMQYLGFKKQRQASHEVIQSAVYRMNDRIMSSLELKKNGTKALMVVPDSSSLQCNLEKFISEGRFTGRTAEEIKGTFGDSREVSDSMEHLLNTKR
ncbi:general transcription factor 3C polypeptide 1, partial [Clonorchis sinensis]